MTACIPSRAYAGFFPAGVVVAEMRAPGDPETLLPTEASAVSRAVPKRVKEFAAGRVCARQALAQLGIVDHPVRAAADRQPIWPNDVVGSITHTQGFCAASVASRRQLLGIGIDTEAIAPVAPDLMLRICVPDEFAWVGSLPALQQAAATMLIFSAKEAFYKCQYPVTGEWLDFHDVLVEPEQWHRFDEVVEQSRPFSIKPTRPVAIAHRATLPALGRYRFHEDYVSTGVVLTAVDEAQ